MGKTRHACKSESPKAGAAALQRLELQPLVQAAASRAAGEHSVRGVFKLEGADSATESVAQGDFFPAGAPPDVPEPDAEHRVQIDEQVDENKRGEADVLHGFG